jgi:hypothetical protein
LSPGLGVRGFDWHDIGVIVGIALLTVAALQLAGVYQVQAFRGRKQCMRVASIWSVVLLTAIGISLVAKVGDQVSRAWLGAFYLFSLLVLIAFRRGLFC